MKKIELTQSIVFLVIVFSIIDSTNAVAENSQTAHIQNYNASTSLESLIEKDLNCTDKSESHLKSRRAKRYVAFPEGSSFSVAFCATVGFVGNPNFIYFSWAINWGLAYDLPNDTWIINEKNRKVFPKQIVQRRHRRDLYDRLENIIDK